MKSEQAKTFTNQVIQTVIAHHVLSGLRNLEQMTIKNREGEFTTTVGALRRGIMCARNDRVIQFKEEGAGAEIEKIIQDVEEGFK